MPGPDRGGRSRFTLILLILTSVTLVTLDVRGDEGVFGGARRAAGQGLSPLSGFAQAVTSPFRDLAEGVSQHDELVEENRELKERLAEVQGARARAERAVRDRDQLYAATKLTVPGDLKRVTARVVALPMTNFAAAVQIDRGSDAGVRKGMPVVTGAGLVGVVARVWSNGAQLQLVSDASAAIGVRVGPNGIPGLLTGAGAGEPLSVQLLGLKPGDTLGLPKKGARILTSGLEGGSDLPADIPVARVAGVSDRRGLDSVVTAQPAVDVDGLDVVQVLLYTPPKPPPPPDTSPVEVPVVTGPPATTTTTRPSRTTFEP